jgi:hypothetical protein
MTTQLPGTPEELLIQTVIQSGLANGELELDGLSDELADERIADYLRNWTSRTGPITTTIDHRPNLLESAISFTTSGQFEMAALHYSTWVEHWANGMVATFALRAGQSHETINSMIRETPLRGKITWLFSLLGMTPLDESRTNLLLDLAGRRNCFVHYKWPENEVNSFRHPNPELVALINRMPACVEYLRDYEENAVFKNSRHHAVRFARARESVDG